MVSQLNDIKVLVTATGAPGAPTMLRHLKNIGERNVSLVGTDVKYQSMGRFMCDGFYTVPPGNEEGKFIDSISDIIAKEKPDVFFPVSSNEILNVAKNKDHLESFGCKVISSEQEPLETAVNKYSIYKTMAENGIPTPEFHWPKTVHEFVSIAKEMGYPKRKLCFKPHVSKGSRGFRILDETISRRDLLMNYKPNSLYMSLNEFVDIFEGDTDFPDFLLMEYLDGDEFDLMALCMNGETLLATTKTREVSRWGVVVLGEYVDRPDIVEMSHRILEAIPLSYNIGLQFIESQLVEINPRVSTFIYQNDLVEPYLSIKLALGELAADDIREYQKKVREGRRFLRYMDQIFWNHGDDPEYYDAFRAVKM
jgi:carbamoyl-phosphate synthase large subunit